MMIPKSLIAEVVRANWKGKDTVTAPKTEVCAWEPFAHIRKMTEKLMKPRCLPASKNSKGPATAPLPILWRGSGNKFVEHSA